MQLSLTPAYWLESLLSQDSFFFFFSRYFVSPSLSFRISSIILFFFPTLLPVPHSCLYLCLFSNGQRNWSSCKALSYALHRNLWSW